MAVSLPRLIYVWGSVKVRKSLVYAYRRLLGRTGSPVWLGSSSANYVMSD
jgi:hypothetical protein